MRVYFPYHARRIEEQVKPENRTNLHWEPEIRMSHEQSTEFSYFTSDLSDEYQMKIEGITDSGVPVDTTNTFAEE